MLFEPDFPFHFYQFCKFEFHFMHFRIHFVENFAFFDDFYHFEIHFRLTENVFWYIMKGKTRFFLLKGYK